MPNSIGLDPVTGRPLTPTQMNSYAKNWFERTVTLSGQYAPRAGRVLYEGLAGNVEMKLPPLPPAVMDHVNGDEKGGPVTVFAPDNYIRNDKDQSQLAASPADIPFNGGWQQLALAPKAVQVQHVQAQQATQPISLQTLDQPAIHDPVAGKPRRAAVSNETVFHGTNNYLYEKQGDGSFKNIGVANPALRDNPDALLHFAANGANRYTYADARIGQDLTQPQVFS